MKSIDSTEQKTKRKVSEDLTGQVFGKLVAIKRVERLGPSWWECVCTCGKVKEIRLNSLKAGHTKSCGCLQKESVTKHGCSSYGNYHAEYWIWKAMTRRTKTAKESASCYKNYRGRGITVCERWSSFENFIADMGARPSEAHSLDRKENSEGYSPKNCRWATQQEQCRNRRSNRLLEYKGETKCLTEWAEIMKIPIDTLSKRLGSGWEVGIALETPVRNKRK